MAGVDIRAVHEALRFDARHPRCRHRDRRRRVLRPGGPVRMRQVDAPADDRRAGGNRRRRDRDRRHRGQPRAAQGARHRDGVPELRPLSAHDRARQHVVRAHAREAVEGGHRRARAEGRRHPRPRALSRPLSARSCPADSGSAWRWAGRSSATRRCSCSTSRCPISTPSCACRCAPRSRSSISAWRPPSIYVTHDQIEAHDDGRQDRRDARRHRRADRRPARPLRPSGEHRSSRVSSARRR